MIRMSTHTLGTDKSDGFDRFESDLNSQLLRSRTLMVGPNLDETNYNLVIAQLLFLQEQDSNQEISLWINSDHPSEVSALAICDMIGSLSCDVRTYCVGKAIGVSAVLLASGKKGKRTASRSSSICLCQPSIKAGGNAEEVGRIKRRIEFARDRTAEILAEITSRSKTEILSAIDREYWMSAEEARDYGIVDQVR
jgi:ATP-dependent Clp protease, protease subunit